MALFLMIGIFISLNVGTNINNNSLRNQIQNKVDQDYLNTQDLDPSNTFTGIGEAWNITHWANRTDTGLAVNFAEGENAILKFPLYSEWEGYKLDANILNFYDTRNWNNGTLNYGTDNGYSTGANDSMWIQNTFQNWTFNQNVVGQGNVMSGNYIDNTEISPNSLSHDCLELRMAGNPYTGSGGQRYWYDNGDGCWWDTMFYIPRGQVLNNVLKFQINPIHLISFNSWELRIYINNIRVFSLGIYTLKGMGINEWHNFSIPQGIWTNTTNVFSSGNLNDTIIPLRVALEYTATSAGYGFEDGENIDYQQILFDNVELVTTAEANPSDLGLKLNNTKISDENWGKGSVELNGEWQGVNNNLDLLFSTDDISKLGSYSVNFFTDVNLFVLKNLPESNYETNIASLGTKVIVKNSSSVEWSCYGRVSVPTRYVENLMSVVVPQDVNITAVYDPQNPNLNILNQCDNSSAGILLIPINSISATPDGFWRFLAKSPNYCEDSIIYGNTTGPWVEDYEFLSGDFVNITAKITNSPIITSYIQNTNALLNVRFPNGTIWADHTQMSQVDSNGMVYFNTFQIPNNPPNYDVGLYDAIITWNNSYSNFGFNESGIIYKQFKVVHESVLIPEEKFYEDNFENSILNLKVTFHDFITNAPIRNAKLYTYDFINPGIKRYFSETSPGYYFLEFNLSGASFGNNSITIYAESANYEDKQVVVDIEVIQRTNLNVDNDFLDSVQYKSNFTIQVDYIDNVTGLGVDPGELYTDWGGDNHFSRISQGKYNLICNASGPGYSAGNLYSFNIYASAYQYESQMKTVRVFITELDSQIDLKLNSTPTEPNAVYIVQVWQQVNITIRYRDSFGNPIHGALVNLTSQEFTKELKEDLLHNQYTIFLNATDLGQGIDNLIVTAEKVNYKPNSIPFIFEIIERQTYFNIYINGNNKTNDPFESVVVTSMVNITVGYYDNLSKFISGAMVSLSGDYIGTLNESTTFHQYTIIINTEDLSIGLRQLKLTAIRPNYELQSKVIRIQVQRITAQINTTSGSPIIIASPGESVKLEVILNNVDFSTPIVGASVNYSWAFGNGVFTDLNNGIYEAVLPNVNEGTYTIVVSAYFGDNYEFHSFEITLTVIQAPGELWIVSFALICTAIAAAALIGYLILYMKVLKYPKPVRKVRKYRRTLMSKKHPRKAIESRESSIKSIYENQISDSKKYLKGKPSGEQMSIDKLIKKNPEDEYPKSTGGEME
ncbi:MAG: hypothetical protein ACFFBH_04420 [Promethearchaeota archaeon]